MAKTNHFSFLFQAVVSAQRINKFMNADELDLKSVSNDENSGKLIVLMDSLFIEQIKENLSLYRAKKYLKPDRSFLFSVFFYTI